MTDGIGDRGRSEETVRRLLAAAMAPNATDPTAADTGAPDPIAAAARTAAALAGTLTRMFGPYGCHALLIRALSQARTAVPALADVHVRDPLAPHLDGLADAARTHGTDTLANGIAVLLATVVSLLGRVVGEKMALQMLERSMYGPDGSPSPVAPEAAEAATTTGNTEGGIT